MGELRTLFKSDSFISVLALVGGLVVLNACCKIVISVYKTFLRPAKDLKKLGKWAIVTGATDGIGKAYAFALAKKGVSVILISRTESKLKAVADEINDKKYSNVETKYVVCDYSNFDKNARDTVRAAIQGLDIGILVNNVGVSYRYPRFFHELPEDEVAALMEINIHSTTWMTRMVIDGMVERKRGAVVNISSGSAMYPLPLLAEYSAAKSYVEKFTLALNAEYGSKGINFQCQIPFYVATKLARMRKSVSVPTPEHYVKVALRFVGQPDAVVSPFWVHGVMGWVMNHMPTLVLTKVIMNMHLAIRKKGLKKDSEKKE